MKKKKGKINFNKKLNKSNLFFKIFFPVLLLVVIVLLLGIILFNTFNPTGNAITGYAELPINPQTPSTISEPTELPTNPQAPSDSNSLDSFSFENTPLWIKIIAGIVILLILIAIIFLIKRLVKR